MDADRVVRRWLVAAVLYFLGSVGLGAYMGASGDHTLATVHSHVSLLGWASMGLTGLIYRAYPAAAGHRLAAWHFGLYQASVPIMLLAVAALVLGNEGAGPVAGAASVAILVSVAMFCWTMLAARSGG